MSDVTEKIQELQENIQKLQILKSIGATHLVISQEKEVYRIQKEILDIDRNQSVDIVDAILPKKCRFCEEKLTQDARLECFEKNGETCKHKPPNITNLFSIKIIRLIVTVSLIIMGLLAFLLLSNIFLGYFPEQRLIAFAICVGGIGTLILLLWRPVKKLFQSF